VAITGASGFVGANLARRLLAGGHDIHLLLRRDYRSWRLDDIADRVRLHEVDLRDEPAVGRVIDTIQPHWVFHLAAYGAYSWQTRLREMVDTNIIGTTNLVAACLRTGFEVFINTGSSSEYGFKAHAPTETEWLEPNSHYAVTKASATLFCRLTAQSVGACMPTLRLYTVYGPYEEPGRLMPALIVSGLSGTLPPLANPNTVRDYVYVDDVVEAYLLAATRPHDEPGPVYNVGTGVQTSLRDVVEIARRELAVAEVPSWGSMPDRQWDTRVWVADSRKIRAVLGWVPRHTLEQGFRLMVNWFRANPRLWELYRVFDRPERGR